MLNVLVAALMEVVDTSNDLKTGNVEAGELTAAKKRFFSALNEFVDYRVKVAMDQRRRNISQERIAVADSINAAVKSTASTIKSISALNSAPAPFPPADATKEEIEIWFAAYKDWYENKRREGITIE